MDSKITRNDLPFLGASFIIPFLLFYFTKSTSLMFDDAAEFALVIKLGSIAHAPGTPAYILAGMAWTAITSLFGLNIVDSLTLFAAICFASSSAILFCIFKKLSFHLSINSNIKNNIICSSCAIAFATAATSWAWANTIEVYSFQVLSLAIALYGLINYHFNRKLKSIILAAIGIGAGLGNHHLTMILFLPFVPMFFLDNLFIQKEKIEQKKKLKVKNENFIKRISKVFSKKEFWILTGTTFIITLSFYLWMMIRAQKDYPFMFGKPDTFSELFYHVKGGSYSQNLTSTSEKIVSSRVPYFIKLTAMQLFVFLPLFLGGILIILKKKLYTLFSIVTIYFLFLFSYQLINDQWSSTDAYMLLPFMVLTIPIFYGAIFYSDKIKGEFIIPLILVIQIIYNYPLHNRRTYPVSNSLMQLLDKSAPQNSIIVISDWTVVIQYYYYRIVENFRPDLTVLNYDFKFTNYKILPILYPEFYNQIKPEYDNFVNELGKVHPHMIINTGCDLDTPVLLSTFKTLVLKVEATAKSQNRFFLSDPRSHYFYSTNNFYNPDRYVSGCFSSSMPGDSIANDNFVKLDFDFLKSDLLFTDPAALDKLVDFQAMLDRHIAYYKSINDSTRLLNSQNAHDKIIMFQRKMKKSMSFAYQN